MNNNARDELELIRLKNNGFLRPRDVVKFARSKKTALHRFFEWDDSAAAQKWRLRQAQELIRVVVIVSEQTSEKVRAFVSLKADQKTGVGYRAMVDVLDDDLLLESLLEDAKIDLVFFSRKYQTLRTIGELNGVFSEIDKAIVHPVKQKVRRSVEAAERVSA